MGVQISGMVQGKEFEMADLAGKKVAIDAFNTCFQFISIIRDRFTGEPLRDSHGNVTSHLSGIMYRFSRMLEAGVRPVMVFDGKPPAFKRGTQMAREERKQAAEKKWKEAVEKGENGYKHAQATSRFTPQMVADAKEILGYMGVPVLQAPSEGEATCAAMCRSGVVDFASSQDYDSLLFGAPRLLRNVSVSGKRKLPNQEVWVEVRPEMLELESVLSELGITREQLVVMGMLIGTDYNDGVKGVGPKTALKLVKEHVTFDAVVEKTEWKEEADLQQVFDFFMDPVVLDRPEIEWGKPQPDRIMRFLADEHDFSRERVEKVVEKIMQNRSKGAQSSLGGWLKK
ncbi:MAG: flap endonuclease-1 [Candidatus Aenigmarchaeota archaeon]|nr:flap endonuclease-1 [Candidatus Aenigmarchaeota archaeon]